MQKNKANYRQQADPEIGGPRGAKCAKQSQFPARPGGTRPQGRGTRSNRAKLPWAGKGDILLFPEAGRKQDVPTGQSRRMPFWWSQCFRSPISLKISLS